MSYEYNPYKVTTIRIRKTDLNILKDIAKEDNRSLNYLINKIIIEYIIIEFGSLLSFCGS